MTWDEFAEAFLDRFMPYTLKDQIRDESDHLEYVSMIVVNYVAHCHALSRRSIASISLESKKI